MQELADSQVEMMKLTLTNAVSGPLACYLRL